MLSVDKLIELCHDKTIAITKHARHRLVERDISIDNVQFAIRHGEIIKQYNDDKPFPSCLILGKIESNKPIHVVVSTDNEYLYIITAYYPDSNEWDANLKTRKGK